MTSEKELNEITEILDNLLINNDKNIVNIINEFHIPKCRCCGEKCEKGYKEVLCDDYDAGHKEHYLSICNECYKDNSCYECEEYIIHNKECDLIEIDYYEVCCAKICPRNNPKFCINCSQRKLLYCHNCFDFYCCINGYYLSSLHFLSLTRESPVDVCENCIEDCRIFNEYNRR